jgi:hypothetical protein
MRGGLFDSGEVIGPTIARTRSINDSDVARDRRINAGDLPGFEDGEPPDPV